MKTQLLFLSLVAAMLAGCSKNEPCMPSDATTHISASAMGAETPESKAPLTGTSLNNQQAQVFTTTSPFNAYTGDKAKMFSKAYARGTMTFKQNSYVEYDQADFSGLAALPGDKSTLYLYGFYPTGWIYALANTYESLSRTFDGKTDVMVTYLTAADQQQIASGGGVSGTLPEKADFLFRHLLTRYNIQVKASDADAQAIWGRIKSIKLKQAPINKISTTENLGYSYSYSAGSGAVAFYKLSGTVDAPTYSDDVFNKTSFADMLALTTSYQNACYTMAAPVAVDANANTAELTLVVTTIDRDNGRELAQEVDLSLDQTNFTAAAIANNTSGYSITVALNFRSGVIQASAVVEAWKDGGDLTKPVKPSGPKVGEFRDGGIIFHVTDANNYKVVSVIQSSGLSWAANSSYVIGSAAQSAVDSKGNSVAIKAAYDNKLAGVAITEATFDLAFPAAAWCYNYQGKDGADAKGSWYLPAKTDFQYLLCAFNGKNPISWEKDHADAPAPDHAARAVFNKYLTDAGGTAMSTDGFWTSTEHSTTSSNAWYIWCSDGDTNGISKGNSTYNVRCIKNISRSGSPTPPVEIKPNVGDVVKGGIVFWVDPMNPTKYKIMSLVGYSGKKWSASTAYSVGCTDMDDGRANVTKIKAYSAAKTGGATGNLDTDFPMAAYCENHATAETPQGQWYLPAVNELLEIQKNKAVIVAAPGFVAGDFTSKWTFSSTEYVSDNTRVHYVYFNSGTTGNNVKTLLDGVRCVASY